MDSSGTILQNIQDILNIGENAFATRFTPPSVFFYLQIIGKDGDGYTFSRISDTAIEVSNIDLMLGKHCLSFVELFQEYISLQRGR